MADEWKIEILFPILSHVLPPPSLFIHSPLSHTSSLIFSKATVEHGICSFSLSLHNNSASALVQTEYIFNAPFELFDLFYLAKWQLHLPSGKIVGSKECKILGVFF
jgi:hypothetical protein